MLKKVLMLLVAIFLIAQFVGPLTVSAASEKPKDDAEKQDATMSNDSLSTVDSIGPAPAIFYPEEVHDFGMVSQNAVLTHVFKVHNTGEDVLKLIKVSAS